MLPLLLALAKSGAICQFSVRGMIARNVKDEAAKPEERSTTVTAAIALLPAYAAGVAHVEAEQAATTARLAETEEVAATRLAA